ncbi:class I SAM-dependent methyltransferase [Conexibacter woesei]|uniref:class I SAM-dependent methyltransferase n=1 Tax=Conexibacter woesei TaxID=191495 RepID=UPI00041C9152|nr:methyltransferase domain-containing protein [Conexibacter woesei]
MTPPHPPTAAPDRAAPAGRLYDAALGGRASLIARAADGIAWPLDVTRWLGPAGGADLRLLTRAAGPVLDVGCGPGRHVRALVASGTEALGLDVSRAAVATARAGGAPVVHGNVFGPVPDAGRWRTALLLDGNLGIGGDPVALLRRVAALLATKGTILVEADPPGTGLARAAVRLDDGRLLSEPFPWARVGIDALAAVARAAGLGIAASWDDEGRWFAQLAP